MRTESPHSQAMTNYFETFSLPAQFAIDEVKLEKKYLELQNEVHPDKANLDDITKSVEINQGYKILSDDFLRACHLLVLKEIDILHDETAIRPDMATLEGALELQEKIEKISDENEIKELRKSLNLQVKDLISQSMSDYKKDDFKNAAQKLVKAKYLKKSLNDLKEKKN